MKKIIALFFIALLSTSCSNSQQQDQSLDHQLPVSFIKNVAPDRFKELVDHGNGIILDIRTPQEIKLGYIGDASIINYYNDDFEEKLNLIQKDQEIYVYCRSGNRSAKAAEILQKNGFSKVYNLSTGIIGWEKNGYPLERSAIVPDVNIQEVSITDFETLLNTDKPVLINFHTVWCAPCRKMAPIIDKIEEEYSNDAVVMRIDIDKSKDLANKYQVMNVPVFMLFLNGEVNWKHNGMISETEVKKQIEDLL